MADDEDAPYSCIMIQGIGVDDAGEHRGQELKEYIAQYVGHDAILHAYFWQALGNIALKMRPEAIPAELTRALGEWCSKARLRQEKWTSDPHALIRDPKFYYTRADSNGNYLNKFSDTTLRVQQRDVIRPVDLIGRNLLILPPDLRIARYLAEHPEAMYQDLTPRQFEELVASLLKSQGFEVRLGSVGRDGGVDVFAERDAISGPELLLVQCKRYRPDRKIGEPIVKQLFTDVSIRNATRGLVATTSTFTREAASFIQRLEYRLTGADQTRLKEWLLQVADGLQQW